MFEDEHLLEGERCGSASHCETLSIAVASLSHQIILSQPPIAFTCSISLFAVFPLRTSPTWAKMARISANKEGSHHKRPLHAPVSIEHLLTLLRALDISNTLYVAVWA